MNLAQYRNRIRKQRSLKRTNEMTNRTRHSLLSVKNYTIKKFRRAVI